MTQYLVPVAIWTYIFYVVFSMLGCAPVRTAEWKCYTDYECQLECEQRGETNCEY